MPVLSPAPVVHVELRGLDTERLRRFYQEVFGWEREEELSIDDYSVQRVAGSLMTAGIGPTPDWSANEATFFIQVEDIDDTLREIETRGGRAVMPRTEGPKVGSTHIVVFTKFIDPAGNVVGLVERPRD